MKIVARYTPYLLVLLAFLGLLGWIRHEQRREERFLNEPTYYAEPDWANRLPAIREATRRQPSDAAKLTVLTEQLTAAYRAKDAPLRFKVVQHEGKQVALRLNAGVMLPRWYTARAARIAYEEARRALGREVPLYIYETYLVGRARRIGECRAHNGVLEVAFR
ncbi:MAG: hypothetical protein N2554_01940 [Fimbriimonadales bacterium]|nr:hypothetical protein [Fimbriimonadales bacterium]